MQRVTTTSTRYHTRYHTFSLSLALVGVICNRLPRVTVKFILKIYVNILLSKIDDNAWEPLANLRENIWVTRVARHVVARSNYGNALQYDISMIVEFVKWQYPSVISISVRFGKSSLLLRWNLIDK